MSNARQTTTKQSANTNDNSVDPSAVKDPNEWKTGDEPATGAQLSYLKTLAHDAGETFDENVPITKSEASKRIDELRQKSPRVQEGS